MILLVSGCTLIGSDTPSPADTAPPVTEEQPCDIGMHTDPEPGADDHFYRDPIRLSFTAEPGDLTVSLSDADGDIPGQLDLSDAEAVFTPLAPLTPAAAHTLSVETCGGLTTFSFTTGPIGEPVDPDAIVGRTWSFTLMSADFIEPDASGVITTLTMGDGYIFTVLDADDATLTLRGGRAAYTDGEWVQDRCAPTADLSAPLDFTDNPFAILSAQTIELGWMHMQQASLSGAFSGDGSEVAGMRFVGTVRITDMTRSFWELKLTEAEACGLLEGFGLTCTECPDDSGPYCIDYELQRITGSPAGPLEARSEAEVALDPECLGQ
jgi:hypothetical protein